jgi:hypothetical protein
MPADRGLISADPAEANLCHHPVYACQSPPQNAASSANRMPIPLKPPTSRLVAVPTLRPSLENHYHLLVGTPKSNLSLGNEKGNEKGVMKKGSSPLLAIDVRFYDEIEGRHGETPTDRIPRRVLPRHEPRPIPP